MTVCLVFTNMKEVSVDIFWNNLTDNVIPIYACLDKNIFCLPIPKNASSYSGNFLADLNWKYYHVTDPLELINKKQIILLRDPIERWCSGFSQDYFFDNLNLDLDDKDTLDHIFKVGALGLHTKLQTEFIKIKSNDVNYLNVDQNLTKNLSTFLNKEIKIRAYTSNRKHGSRMDNRIKEKIYHIVNTNPKYKSMLIEFLKKDIELYNSVLFYNG